MMMDVNDDNDAMSSPIAEVAMASAAALTSREDKSGVKAAAAETVSHVVVATAPSSSTPRRRWRQASAIRGGTNSSSKDKENTTTSKSTAISTSTPSKTSKWGLWRSSNDDGTIPNRRRSFGISPKAFHASAPAAAAAPAHGATSHGIISSSPTTTKTNGNKAGQDVVLELHATVQSNLIKEGKRLVMERQKLKQSAYKQVTSLKTWPLQERALVHYQQLMNQHLRSSTRNTRTTIQEDKEETKETSSTCCQHPSSSAATTTTCLSTPMAAASAPVDLVSGTLSASSMSSSSSSSSAFSIENNEPKRLLRDLCLSPAKSRLKFQLQQEFLQQQAMTKITTNSTCSSLQLGSEQHDFGGEGPGPALWCMEPRIFSVEKSELGKRKYVVGHAGRFLDYYWRKVNRQHRHYYELILQDTPCRLYLDLEFHRQANPDITNDVAEVFLTQLLHSLSRQLHESFPDQFGAAAATKTTADSDFHPPLILNRTHIVDLDSSTEKKFSRHWIVHLPGGYLFAHTTALGRFMQEWVGNILTASQQAQQQQAQGGDKAKGDGNNSSHVLFEHLFVNPPPSSSSSSKPAAPVSALSGNINNKICLIDLGVYTRNRLFRLMGSTKFGKPPCAALRIADTNEFAFPKGFGNECFYLPAMTEHQQQLQEPLSSQGSKQSDDTGVEVAVEKFAAAIDWTIHAEALAQTLVVPLNASKIDFPILPFDKEAAANASGPVKARSNTTKSSLSYASSSLSFGRSPFPMVDDFVLRTLATRGGGDGNGGIIQGSIRAWSLECHVETGAPLYLTFQMSRNRYCECVGRAHKSNNIAWRVDLVLFQAVQTCHDPQCRALQFRGTPVPLPYSVQQQIQQQLQFESVAATADNDKNDVCDDDGFEGVGDDAVLKALAAMNLEEIESRVGAAGYSGDAAIVPPTQQNGCAKEENVQSSSPMPDNDDFDDDFPDDALAEAIMSNPELFP